MAQTMGRWLYSAYQWMDPPGAPWWRLFVLVMGPPVALVVLIEALYASQVVASWVAWFR